MKTITTTKIEQLKGASNQEIWRIRIRALLTEKGLLDSIKVRKEFPKSTSKDTIEEYLEKRTADSIKAAAIIRLNLGASPLIQTRKIDEDDAEALYNRLEALYESKGFSSEFLIAKQLFSTTLKGVGNSIESYLTKIRAYTNELALREKAISTEIIAAYTLNNLTPEYEYLVVAITQSFRNEEEIDLDDLFNAIIDESRRIKDKEPQEEIAMTTNSVPKKNSTKKRNIKCYNCEKMGHYARECRKPKTNEWETSDEKGGAPKETSFLAL